ncbi:hypothetical protein EON79_10490 [bacterium]|nr:MAG: hypothetical protein EON79_10490 [bacterium]
MEHLSGGKVTLTDEISYPDSIPDAKFALVAPPGVEIRRSEVALEGARRGLRKGIGTRKVSNQTVTLRGLLSDGGSLTILWTGSDLPSDGSIRATLVGASLRPAYGIPALSSKPEKDASFKPAIYAGLPVRGQSFFTPKGSERRYTVRIPVLKGGRKGGEAVFRDVAVTDISSIYAVGDPMMSPRKGKAAP